MANYVVRHPPRPFESLQAPRERPCMVEKHRHLEFRARWPVVQSPVPVVTSQVTRQALEARRLDDEGLQS